MLWWIEILGSNLKAAAWDIQIIYSNRGPFLYLYTYTQQCTSLLHLYLLERLEFSLVLVLILPECYEYNFPWCLLWLWLKCGEWMYRFVQASLCRSVYRRSLWALVTVQVCAMSVGMKASVWGQAYQAYWAKRKWKGPPNQGDMVKIHHHLEMTLLQSFSSFYCCGWCHTMLLLRDCNKGQNLVKSGLTKHEEQGAILQGIETLTVQGQGTGELNRREVLSLHPLSPGHKQWASLKM